MSTSMLFSSIESALEDLKQGKMLIVCDDEDRENEGDFVMAAEKVTPEHINFMAQFGRGLICAPLTAARAEELGLSPMVQGNTSHLGTPFTESIDLKVGNSTGISAADRARTILAMVNPHTRPSDFLRPGHMFPLVAREGGVLERNGHTEATVDLARMAGLSPIGILCEIMNEDGTMSRVPELAMLAKKTNLKMISIKDLIEYRKKTETLIKALSLIDFPNEYGNFKLQLFENTISTSEQPMAIYKGDFSTPSDEPVLVRVHSECLTGDIFLSKRCDCGEQLKKSMELIERRGKGILIYLRQEGRGIGLKNKLRAYDLQEKGHDTVSANLELGLHADPREYYLAAQILKHMSVSTIELLTNNPKKSFELEKFGIEVRHRIPIEVSPNPFNSFYLQTKKDKMGHLLSSPLAGPTEQSLTSERL